MRDEESPKCGHGSGFAVQGDVQLKQDCGKKRLAKQFRVDALKNKGQNRPEIEEFQRPGLKVPTPLRAHASCPKGNHTD